MLQLAICRYALINWLDIHRATSPYQWASYQIRKKIWVAHAPGMPGTFSPPLRVSDPDMHHGTCVTHVPWCMPGSLYNGILWGRWRGKRSRHSRRMRNQKFCASGKRPITTYLALYISPGLDGFNNASCIHSATNKTDTDQKPHTLYQQKYLLLIQCKTRPTRRWRKAWTILYSRGRLPYKTYMYMGMDGIIYNVWTASPQCYNRFLVTAALCLFMVRLWAHNLVQAIFDSCLDRSGKIFPRCLNIFSWVWTSLSPSDFCLHDNGKPQCGYMNVILP